MARLPRQQWKLEPGCLVYLRSGSQRMVVTKVEAGDVDLVWQDYATKEMGRATVPIIAVEVVQPAPSMTDETEERS